MPPSSYSRLAIARPETLGTLIPTTTLKTSVPTTTRSPCWACDALWASMWSGGDSSSGARRAGCRTPSGFCRAHAPAALPARNPHNSAQIVPQAMSCSINRSDCDGGVRSLSTHWTKSRLRLQVRTAQLRGRQEVAAAPVFDGLMPAIEWSCKRLRWFIGRIGGADVHPLPPKALQAE
jgi:hypothetical protein